ncbi:peroxisomal [Trichonephila clavipes]|uniref:Peroxisomal n=1 Tax=Trichonephila clavipes TaxID=2585209 RepID=A0A8X6SXC2_TRICX|nr:peroxisomal [Trichonephila clavipes]
MSLSLLGHPVGMPLGVSPVAFQKMAHPDGEIGTARALASHGGVMILSMLSTTALEDLPNMTPPGSVHWLQIYIAKDRDITKALIHRADIAGYKAIVVTADSPVNGMWGVNMVHNLTLPPHLRLPNLQAKGEVEGAGSNLRSKVGFSLLDPTLTWKDIQWIQTFTALPIVVKGVLTAEDAVLAVEHGASGILVSNHGGRQLDGVPATKSAAEAHRMLSNTHGEAAISERTCREWFQRFKNGDFDVEDQHGMWWDQLGVVYYELLKPTETITGDLNY